MNHLCHSLILTCAGCNHPTTHTQKNEGVGQGIQIFLRCVGAVKCLRTRPVCTLLAENPWVFPCLCIGSHSKQRYL